MKIAAAETWLREQLQPLMGNDEAAAVAGYVLEHLTGYDRAGRLSHGADPLQVHQLHHLTEYCQRLTQGEPMQYILQTAPFCGLHLYVDQAVLIPRPETEELVQWVVEDVRASGLDVFTKGPVEADATTQLKIVDVGTGSGCIALALKHKMPKAEVWGCDVSDAALNVARRNSAMLDIRVDFQGIDILSEPQQHALPTADIIISNPPYIPRREAEQLAANVVRHEPREALFVPDEDALLFYKALVDLGKSRLYEGGAMYMEIHQDLGKDVQELFTAAGYQTELRKDISGNDRMVRATRPKVT